MILLPSVVRVSSNNESGATRGDCLVQFSIVHFYLEPHELIVVHELSTNEFGDTRSDCLVQVSNLIG